MDPESEKKRVGYAAAEHIKNGDIVGIGTGSTVHFFIERLIERVREGLSITAVSSSIDSLNKAQAGGISCVDIETVRRISVTVDGADEIDPNFGMIKGGGGALFREKLLAVHSDAMIVIVDASKRVSLLGKNHPLPVEILPFYHSGTIRLLKEHGYNGSLRHANGTPYTTDNHNYIFDIAVADPIHDPSLEHMKLLSIPGVLETGLFFDVATTLLYPGADGNVCEERR